MISITDIARNTVKKLMMEDGFDHSTDFVRVGVKSGGCSGLSYQLKFDKMIKPVFFKIEKNRWNDF